MLFDWTWPNLGKYYNDHPPIRGSLNERLRDAKRRGINRVELPFDLIRDENKESRWTGKEVGDLIEAGDFKFLYRKERFDGEYILHTDPELKPGHSLFWNRSEWRKKYIRSIIGFSDFIGKAPYAIEFHPSAKERDGLFTVRLIIEAFDELKNGIAIMPYILLENRKGKSVSNVGEMVNLYDLLKGNLSKGEMAKFGFSIDIAQLYSQMRRDPIYEIKSTLPKKAMLCWHIHFQHKVPFSTKLINWQAVVMLILELDRTVLLPEVLNEKDVDKTIQFIEKLASTRS